MAGANSIMPAGAVPHRDGTPTTRGCDMTDDQKPKLTYRDAGLDLHLYEQSLSRRWCPS